jgi:hypothetical protein
VTGLAARLALAALLAALAAPCDVRAQVYRWVDENGVTHLSTSKPPPGVEAERLEVPRSKSSASARGGSRAPGGGPGAAPASASQVAEREQLLAGLRNRECVIALETLDRLTTGGKPVEPAELRRLQQTAELNCSRDPARRRQQEEMAAQLRVANGPECVAARNRLADMMAPGSAVSRDVLRTEQEFVDEHCTPPVR